jgi:hypothetical protein
MAATAERQQVTQDLLGQIEGTRFPSAGQLDRIERLITTREELEDYIAVLIERTEETRFPAGHMLDRLERLLRVLRRFDEETREARRGERLALDPACRLPHGPGGFLPRNRIRRHFPRSGVELTCSSASSDVDRAHAAGQQQFATTLRPQRQEQGFRKPEHRGSLPAPYRS